MVGNSEQFAKFREIFRGHIAGADESELQEISIRLSQLSRDVVMRQDYQRRFNRGTVLQGVYLG